MIVWVLTVVSALGTLEHVETFTDGKEFSDAMFDYAVIDQLDARCHKVTHETGAGA